VRLHDEGDYVLASYVEIRNGVLSVNLDAIETWRVHLRKYELTSTLDHVESAISLATRGVSSRRCPPRNTETAWRFVAWGSRTRNLASSISTRSSNA
jgi:hypothetical protein